MKVTDMIVSAIIKRGILYEVRNCDMEFDVPSTQEVAPGVAKDAVVKIRIKAEHMTLRVDKE